MLQGLPDLTPAAPSHRDEVIAGVLPPYEAGDWTALPTALRIARRGQGLGPPNDYPPDLKLAEFRPTRIGETPPPGGTIDFRFQVLTELDAALTAARQLDPAATVAPASITSGYLSMRVATPGMDAAPGLGQPVPIVWDGLGAGRFTLACTPEIASSFATLLRDGTAALAARADLEFRGVAARSPLQISFDPAALVAEIETHLGQNGIVPRSALLSFLQKPPASVLILSGQWPDDPDGGIAATLTDWLRARFASLAPAPAAGAETYLDFGRRPDSGAFTWDLSKPIVTWRPIVIEFDPLADIRDFVAAHGADSLITQTEMPSIPTGLNMVSVTANLPSVRPGLLELGVTLEALPRPPVRMYTARASTMLIPPDDAASLMLHLAPEESLDYNVITYAVPQGAPDLQGTGVPHNGPTLRLHMDDFPVDFFPVKASAGLLQLCTARLTFHPAAGAMPPQTADLDLSQPAAAFSQPMGATGAMISAELHPLDGTAPLVLGPVPASNWSLDLCSCATYGPQQATISVNLGTAASYAVELLPEGLVASGDSTTVLAFTPGQTQRTYRYVSTSPFHGGYCWREYRSTPPLADWSLAKPDLPLALTVTASVVAPT